MMIKKKAAIEGGEIILRHATQQARVARLTESMADGWTGRPVVLYLDNRNRLRNVTGCHRIAAAVEVGEFVEAIILIAGNAEEMDRIEFAAANDDIDAANTLRPLDSEIAELVLRG